MTDRAFITPKVLKWARESARMSEKASADKVPVSVEKLKEWEEGTSQPTIRQAKILAKTYRRPFALLFLPEVPRDFQPLQDFRRKTAKPLGTGSIFIIREIQQKQAWIIVPYIPTRFCQDSRPDTGIFHCPTLPSVRCSAQWIFSGIF